MTGTIADRLRAARQCAGFKSARAAAEHHRFKPSTYAAHENGQNAYDSHTARIYAQAFGVEPAFLLFGEGPAAAPQDPIEALQQAWDTLDQCCQRMQTAQASEMTDAARRLELARTAMRMAVHNVAVHQESSTKDD